MENYHVNKNNCFKSMNVSIPTICVS